MALIKLSYNLAINQANEIKKAGTTCGDVADEITKQIAVIQQSWEGDTADALILKLNSLKSEYSTLSSTLNDNATSLINIANNIKDADEKD